MDLVEAMRMCVIGINDVSLYGGMVAGAWPRRRIPQWRDTPSIRCAVTILRVDFLWGPRRVRTDKSIEGLFYGEAFISTCHALLLNFLVSMYATYYTQNRNEKLKKEIWKINVIDLEMGPSISDERYFFFILFLQPPRL